MAKRKWTDEERKAFGEKMKKLRQERLAKAETPRPEARKEQVLDLTKEKNFATEAEFVRYIHWDYDAGKNPDVIKITSHQALVVASFTKMVPVKGYNSPFGSHRIEIVNQKELEKQDA